MPKFALYSVPQAADHNGYQICSVPSAPAEATRLLSGDHATARAALL